MNNIDILFREVIWSLDDSEKYIGSNYGSSDNVWKHFQVQIKPSKYEKQVLSYIPISYPQIARY